MIFFEGDNAMKTMIPFSCLALLLFLNSSSLFAQQDFSNEVIVYFKSGARRVAQTTQANVEAPAIRAVLQKHGVAD